MAICPQYAALIIVLKLWVMPVAAKGAFMGSVFGIIIAAGIVEDYGIHRAMLSDLPAPRRVYCADGGLRHMEPLGLAPDLILGDLDSADPSLINRFQNNGAQFERYPAEKDYTDTELAVERAAGDGCDTLLIFGALGARIDHTFTNIQLIFKYISRGIRIAIADCYGMASVLVPGCSLRIYKRRPLASLLKLLPEAESASALALAPVFANPKLSILPIGGIVRGVRTSGLKYALCGADLEACYTVGVSNEFMGAAAMVEIEDGAVLIMICADKQAPPR